jgi:hypothetical protein
LGDDGRTQEAMQFSTRAVEIQEGLLKKEPSNREYKMELAQFYSVMANLLVDKNQMELAEQRNQKALALLDELAMPSSSLRMERAEALKLRDWLLNSEERKKR